MASAFGSSTTGSNAASFQPCNASRMRLTPSRSTPSWISAFENGPSIQPIFVYHPQGKLHEVQYARRVVALEDKIVQRAVAAMLNAIYEEDFLGFSYGFRPGRGAHDAMDALCVGIHSKKVSWILDAYIRSFFDEISQERLIRSEAPDWRSTHHPPDPEMAEGGRPRRRGRNGE